MWLGAEEIKVFKKPKEMVVEIRNGVCFMQRGGSREVRHNRRGVDLKYHNAIWLWLVKEYHEGGKTLAGISFLGSGLTLELAFGTTDLRF